MFTLRWFALALLIPALLIGAAFLPGLAAVAGIYALGLLAATGLDRRGAGAITQFRASRKHDSKLSLGAANPITIQVESRAPRAATLTILDEPPVGFVHATPATLSLTLDPRTTESLQYQVRPVRRGDFHFGNLNLRWPGPLGLFIRQGVIQAEEAVKVYPNIYAIRQYELLVRNHQLTEMGVRSVRQRGEGTAFESLRDYTPDDSFRSINWKATARRGKPISTDYEPERSQRVLIMLDVGRMMRGAIRAEDNGEAWSMAKVDFVINSILLLSYVANRKGDQVGLLVFADEVKQFLPPEPGRAHFQKLLDQMYALHSEPIEADYGRAVTFLKARQKKRALVVCFTDLSGARASESLLAHMPRLRIQHLPLLVTIRDPMLDQQAQQSIHDSAQVYQRAVAQQLLDERHILLQQLRQRGVLTLDVDAAHLSAQVVNRYLELKGSALI
jgi:uncharacterized protein (DUF58 family)